MSDPRYDDATLRLVRVLGAGWSAERILVALAGKGLLLPPGGETREEWRATPGPVVVFGSQAEASKHAEALRMWGGITRPLTIESRTAVSWPDGSEYITAWTEVTDEHPA